MIKPLTNSLYLNFSGDPPPATIKGFASVTDGNVYAIGGTSFIAGRNFIIFGVKKGFNKRDIIRGWNAIKKTLDSEKTYYAIIDRDLDTAAGLLEHCGFSYMTDDIYIYEG